LACSYAFQAVIFGFLIYSSVVMKQNYFFIILIVNNLLFVLVDLVFRIVVEYKMRNRVM
jgi:hypothetical protein